ncbi:helix-turn-helix domain-containing protein [Rhodocyclaceae bacterium SMB388]
MSEKYNPVAFDPHAFAEESSKRDPAFREAYEGMADEFAALGELLRARQRAGLTQTELAERMGVSQPVVARIEGSIGSRKHAPSIATLRKYADACGQRLVIRFEPKQEPTA